jgi:hypothetical protein
MRHGANAVRDVNCKIIKAFNDLDDFNVSTSNGVDSDDGKGLNVDSNVLDLTSAVICSVCAEGTAVSFACWARLQANGTITIVAILAWK